MQADAIIEVLLKEGGQSRHRRTYDAFQRQGAKLFQRECNEDGQQGHRTVSSNRISCRLTSMPAVAPQI